MRVNKYKKAFCIACAGLFTVMVAGCNEKAGTDDVVLYQKGMQYTVSEKGTPVEYATHSFDIIGGRDVMPIAGFCGPWKSGGSIDGVDYPNFLDEEYIKMVRDSGINTIVYSNDRVENVYTDIEKLLQVGEKIGMGFYLHSWYVENIVGGRSPEPIKEIDTETLYQNLEMLTYGLKYKSFLGLWFMDEVFPNNQGLNAVKMKNAIRDLGFDMDFYSNALGYYEGDWTWYNTCPPTSYAEYMEIYKQLDLKMFSTTIYPYGPAYKKYNHENLTDEETDDVVKDLIVSVLKNREIGIETNSAVWRMMGAGHQFDSGPSEQIAIGPDEGEFLFDANLALAVGSKCIQIFVPCPFPPDQQHADGSYDTERNSLIGMTGKKNQWYFYTQKLTKQIEAIDHVLMNAANMGILACGNQATNLCSAVKGKEGYIEGNSWRQLKSVTGDSAFVGCFDYLGGTALYVVNSSRNNRAATTLEFDNNYCYDVTQRGQTATVVGTRMTLNLQPGEGALIVLK